MKFYFCDMDKWCEDYGFWEEILATVDSIAIFILFNIGLVEIMCYLVK